MYKHQKCVEHMLKNDSLLLYHGTGTGKSMTFIEIANALKRTTILFTSMNLQDNIKKYIIKFGKVPIYNINYDSIHLWKKYKKLIKKIGTLDGTLVAIDEAHNFFQKSNKIIEILIKNKTIKLLLMTATPITSDHGELELMFSAMAHDVIDEITPGISKSYVSYYEANGKNFPKIIGPKIIEETMCDISNHPDNYLMNNLDLVCPMLNKLIHILKPVKTYIYSKTPKIIKHIFDLQGIKYFTQIDDFNKSSNGIFISDVGIGLSFIGVNEVHILADVTVPGYQQIIGRAARMYSHKYSKDKTVTIYLWSTNWHKRIKEYEPIEKKLNILRDNHI